MGRLTVVALFVGGLIGYVSGFVSGRVSDSPRAQFQLRGEQSMRHVGFKTETQVTILHRKILGVDTSKKYV